MSDDKTGNGTKVDGAPVGVADFFPGLARVSGGQSEASCSMGPGRVQPTPYDSGRRAEKARIESLAVQAARAGHTLLESCPFPFHQWQGEHFRACFMLAGGNAR